jgi:hypothetical protein
MKAYVMYADKPAPADATCGICGIHINRGEYVGIILDARSHRWLDICCEACADRKTDPDYRYS